MSIESDLKRLADAAEGILAHLTGTPAQKRGPGRPRRTESVDPPPADDGDINGAGSAEAAQVSNEAVAQAPKASVPAAAPAPTAPAQNAVVTLDQVKDVVKKALAAGKRDAVLALVNKHGGQSASTIPEGNRFAFYDEASQLVAS